MSVVQIVSLGMIAIGAYGIMTGIKLVRGERNVDNVGGLEKLAIKGSGGGKGLGVYRLILGIALIVFGIFFLSQR